MKLEAPQYVSDLFSTKKTTEPHFAVNGFKRTEQHFNHSCSQLVDIHSKHGVRICYFRVTSGDPTTKVCVSTGTVSHAVEGSEFGVLLRVNYEVHTLGGVT